MSTFSSFPKFDLTAFDLSKLPRLDLPRLDLPRLDLAKLDDKVAVTAKNAAYLTVGIGVAAFERLERARRSASAVASDAVGSLTGAVASGLRQATKIGA